MFEVDDGRWREFGMERVVRFVEEWRVEWYEVNDYRQ